MAVYQYSIGYKKGALHSNADGLSHLPVKGTPELEQDTPAEVLLLVKALQEMPITHTQIRMCTRRDPVLELVSRYIFQGWPSQVSDIKPYFAHSLELSLHEGFILWENRIVVHQVEHVY